MRVASSKAVIGAKIVTVQRSATFTFWQAYTLTKQTQILSAQSVDSAAQAITEERSTAKQLELLGKEVEASKDAAVAAKRAADTAAGELELSERPWISVESVRIPDDQSLIVGNKVIMTTVAVAIRNIGRSPATNVSVRVQLTMGGTGSFEDTVRGVCENAVGDNRTPFGQTIFQDKAGTPIEYPITLPPNEVAAYWKQPAGSFSVFGCAGYRSSFSRKSYYTAFIYAILLKKYPDSPIKIPGRDTFLQSALAGFITK
jgi:hypothetical protein